MTLACFSEQIIEYCLSVVISIEELGDIRPFRAGDCPVLICDCIVNELATSSLIVALLNFNLN